VPCSTRHSPFYRNLRITVSPYVVTVPYKTVQAASLSVCCRSVTSYGLCRRYTMIAHLLAEAAKSSDVSGSSLDDLFQLFLITPFFVDRTATYRINSLSILSDSICLRVKDAEGLKASAQLHSNNYTVFQKSKPLDV